VPSLHSDCRWTLRDFSWFVPLRGLPFPTTTCQFFCLRVLPAVVMRLAFAGAGRMPPPVYLRVTAVPRRSLRCWRCGFDPASPFFLLLTRCGHICALRFLLVFVLRVCDVFRTSTTVLPLFCSFSGALPRLVCCSSLTGCSPARHSYLPSYALRCTATCVPHCSRLLCFLRLSPSIRGVAAWTPTHYLQPGGRWPRLSAESEAVRTAASGQKRKRERAPLEDTGRRRKEENSAC